MPEDMITDQAITGRSSASMGSENTFSGALSLFRRPYSRHLDDVDLIYWGVPYDLAVTNRPGTRFGPRAIRAVSSQLAWNGGYWPWAFDPFTKLKAIDYGDMDFDFGQPAGIAAEIEAAASGLIAAGATLITMGGDHWTTYPLLKAHAAKHGPVALIQFDSHSDTWSEDDKRIDHGTMFYHAAKEGVIDTARSVQVGIRTGNTESHGFTVIDAAWMHEHSLDEIAGRIIETVGAGPAYLTFDIDFLDPAFAPGTGTPVCGGFSTWQGQSLIRRLGALDIVGADLVEVSPPYDHAEITALAGAHILLDLTCLLASKVGS